MEGGCDQDGGWTLAMKVNGGQVTNVHSDLNVITTRGITRTLRENPREMGYCVDSVKSGKNFKG